MASKFAKCELGGLPSVVCNVGAYSKLKTKPKTIRELKESLQVIWSNLPQALQQDCERLLKLSD